MCYDAYDDPKYLNILVNMKIFKINSENDILKVYD